MGTTRRGFLGGLGAAGVATVSGFLSAHFDGSAHAETPPALTQRQLDLYQQAASEFLTGGPEDLARWRASQSPQDRVALDHEALLSLHSRLSPQDRVKLDEAISRGLNRGSLGPVVEGSHRLLGTGFLAASMVEAAPGLAQAGQDLNSLALKP